MKTRILLLISFLYTTLSIAQTFTFEGFTYVVNSTNPNEVTLTNGNNASGDVIIPVSVTFESIDFSVTAIGRDAFRDDNITNLTIGSNVQNIGNNAFRDISTLTTVTSNNSTAPSLGASVFRDTPANKTLTIPNGSEASYNAANWNTNFLFINGLPRIGVQFDSNGFTYSITSNNLNTVSLANGNNASGDVIIPASITFENIDFNVTEIGRNAFRGDNITNIIIGINVQNIRDNAFRDISTLTTITSNNSTAPSLGASVFRGTPSDKSLTIPNGSEASYEAANWNTNFLFVNGTPQIGNQFNDNGFTYTISSNSPNAVSLTNGNNVSGDVIIPASVTFENIDFSVTAIGRDAFRSDNITNITIGINVQNIRDNAFRDVSTLTTVTSNNSTAPSLGASVFRGTPSDKSLTIPNGSEASYEAANWNTNFLFVNGTPQIGNQFNDNGFTYTISSNSPNAVSLTNGNNTSGDVIIPASVTFESIDFSVTAIGQDAFRNDDITNLTIGSNVQNIGNNAFRDISTLTTVTSNNSTAPSLGARVFSDTPANKTLTIPNGSEASYEAANWNANFFTINNTPTIGFDFSVDDFNYRVVGNNPNRVALTGGTAIDNLVIPENISFNGLNFLVTTIGAIFRNETFNRVTLPSTITLLQRNAFQNAVIDEVISLATNPPTLERDNFSDRENTILTVPNGREEAYRNGGWNGFFTINDVPSVGINFTVGDFNYRIVGNAPNQVSLTGGIASDDLVIPEEVTFRDFVFQVIQINFRVFENTNFNSVTLPSTITRIGKFAFRFSEIETLTVLAANPPTLEGRTFGDRAATELILPNSDETTYVEGGWTGFEIINGEFPVGSRFDNGDFSFLIKSKNPFIVQLVGFELGNPNVVVPATVISQLSNITYTVTEISGRAFRGKAITSINFPNTITAIFGGAFENTQLTKIIIPENVTTINPRAFFDIETLTEITINSDLTTLGFLAFGSDNVTKVTSLSTDPITISPSNGIFASQDDEIDLFIPSGTRATYLARGWDNFKSITEIDFGITLSPIVYLQGAATNPNSGQEDLMRDNLRTSGLLPTTSPYIDGATVGEIMDGVANPNPENDCVDWVFVELRDPNDNSVVVTGKSAFLQRDGDIVNTDGSALSFSVGPGDYFVAINHRNHLAIVTAAPVTLSATTTVLDFLTQSTLVQGGTVALQQVGDRFTMISGDSNNDGQVLSTDIIQVVAEIGTSGYSNTDLDMNGQILSTDIIIGNQNIGRGQQF